MSQHLVLMQSRLLSLFALHESFGQSGSSLSNRTISSLPRIEIEERGFPRLDVDPAQLESGEVKGVGR
jgi:hypothetical protein